MHPCRFTNPAGCACCSVVQQDGAQGRFAAFLFVLPSVIHQHRRCKQDDVLRGVYAYGFERSGWCACPNCIEDKPIRGHRLCSRERFLQCYKALEKSRREREREREIGSHILCRGRDVIVQSQSGTGRRRLLLRGLIGTDSRSISSHLLAGKTSVFCLGALQTLEISSTEPQVGSRPRPYIEAFLSVSRLKYQNSSFAGRAVLPRCQAALLSPTRELAEQSAKAPMVHSGL